MPDEVAAFDDVPVDGPDQIRKPIRPGAAIAAQHMPIAVVIGKLGGALIDAHGILHKHLKRVAHNSLTGLIDFPSKPSFG